MNYIIIIIFILLLLLIFASLSDWSKFEKIKYKKFINNIKPGDVFIHKSDNKLCSDPFVQDFFKDVITIYGVRIILDVKKNHKGDIWVKYTTGDILVKNDPIYYTDNALFFARFFVKRNDLKEKLKNEYGLQNL